MCCWPSQGRLDENQVFWWLQFEMANRHLSQWLCWAVLHIRRTSVEGQCVPWIAVFLVCVSPLHLGYPEYSQKYLDKSMLCWFFFNISFHFGKCPHYVSLEKFENKGNHIYNRNKSYLIFSPETKCFWKYKVFTSFLYYKYLVSVPFKEKPMWYPNGIF